MTSFRVGSLILRHLCSTFVLCLALATVARAQEPPPPAYLAVVEGAATLEREGDVQPAVQNMPFVPGDRLRTANGRVEIVFPDGSGIEVGEYSEVESISPTRVRLIAGTMDHLQRQIPQTASSSYLPQDLGMYASTLDQNGAWQYDAPYGYVWYPTVAPDWRPYYNGYWSPVRSYGWTWIGVDTWAWPTHHYGRWGYQRDRWFWIPGRTWGPAWVSWAGAADYVSWCPLGFDSRPVFALSVGSRGARAGWTVLPRSGFGAHGYYAHRYAVDTRRIPVNIPFIAHTTPPLPRHQPGTGSRQLSAIGRQPPGDARSPAGSRQPSAIGRQPPVSGGGQRPVAVPRNADTDRQAQPDSRVQPDRGWARNPQTGVQTHYGVAVPRTTVDAPASTAPRATPDARPTPAPDYRLRVPDQYRPGVPVYRSPNDYSIQRMDPRVREVAPSAPTPGAAPPAADPGAARTAVPRAGVPSGRPSAPAPQAPSQRAPQSAPQPPSQAAPPARSAPPQATPRGEARPRGEGRPAEGRRPR